MDKLLDRVDEYVPIKSRIWVSAADGACAILQNIIGGGALTYYFTRVRGLNPDLAGLVWILFGIWNAINDPLFGYISDKTKNKLGRRIPYIRYGAPFIALSFVVLWIDFADTQTLLFIHLLIGLFIYDALYTAIATSIYIMPYEMAVSNKARSGIFIWKIIFFGLATAIPLIIIPIIQPGPGDDPTTFRWVMTILGLVMGTIVFLSTYFYQEKHFQQEEKQYPFFKSLTECFKNISFIIFEVVSFTIIYVQTGLMQGVLYYFDELKVPAAPIYISLFVGIICGIFLWIYRREQWGVKRCLQIWSLLFAFGSLLLVIFGRILIPSMIGFLMIGFGFSGALYLIPIMNGDVIDYDEHRTGLRREGMYAGINSFITKPAISLAQAVFLKIITLFGYNQSLEKGLQPVSAQTGILLGWALVPAILLSICFIALKWYPLTGPSWEKIKKELSTIHDKKGRVYLETKNVTYTD